jgi:hypothetical protein
VPTWDHDISQIRRTNLTMGEQPTLHNKCMKIYNTSRLSTQGVRILNPLQFHIKRLSLSCIALLALELLKKKVLFHYHCSFLQLFHPCINVIGHWSSSLQWTTPPTSKTISKSHRLTRVRDLVSKVSHDRRVRSNDWSCNWNHNRNQNITWLEITCLKQELDNMYLNYLILRNNHC